MGNTLLKIEGISCGHCVAKTDKALREVPGVESVKVNLDAGQASIIGNASTDALIKAVNDAGYKASVAE